MKKRNYKKILLITGIVLLVLWFGANGAMYMYIVKTFINPDNEKYMNSTPESMVLDVPQAEGIPIELMGLRMNLPHKDDIDEVWVSFWDHKIWMVDVHYFFEGNIFSISFEREIRVCEGSLVDKKCGYNDSSGYEAQRNIQYAKPNDYSFWNLPCNYVLSQQLVLKSMYSPMHFKSFELQTPYLEGFLLDNSGQDEKAFFASASFLLGDCSVDIRLHGTGNDENESLAKSIIASIRPAEGEQIILSEQLPEELILVLRMEREGVTVSKLKQLRNIMEEKGYLKDLVSDISKEIEELNKLSFEALNKALEINPGDVLAYFMRACTYALIENKELALKDLAKAIELDGKFKKEAREDEDFKSLWDDPDFISLTQ